MYEEIKQEINQKITTNGQGDITGSKLNEVLQHMILAVETEAGGTDIVNGYYNAVDGNFYEDDEYTLLIIGQDDKIYISLDSNAMYRYDITDQAFVQVGDSSGERRINGTMKDGHYKKVEGSVGDYAVITETGNPDWRYFNLYVNKGETVFYKTVDRASTIQPVCFVDSNGIIRFLQNGESGTVYQGTYEAQQNGVFTINVRHDSHGWDEAYLYLIRTQGSGTDERVDGLIESVTSLQGRNGINWKEDSLDNGQEIDLSGHFPACNKFGNKIQLTCKFTAFNTIKFWFGNPGPGADASYDYRMLEIDSSTINLYGTTDTTTPVESVGHNLSISDYISVTLDCLDDGTLKVSINTLNAKMTIDGNDYCILEKWKYGVGNIRFETVTSLNNVQLSVTNQFFRSPLWMFGASQEGISDIRFAGQLKNMGYLNCLVNARSGRNTQRSLEDVTVALRFGCPKYLYISFSNDGYDPSDYMERLNAAIALTEENGIELIVQARPIHPQHGADDTIAAQLAKRSAVLESGCRVFDFGKAVSADPEDPSAIYAGYLDSGDVHPITAQAANAIAMQFCADVPEIMQYG